MLSEAEQQKQIQYRDARLDNRYDDIWQNVGKCAFCDLKEKYIIFEENNVVLTITLFAYIDGHCMIIPRRHVRSPKELTQQEWETVRKFMYIAKRLIKDVHGVKGTQLVQKDGVAAQSTVEHLHFHCVPFDKPDLNVWNYRKLKNTPLENAALYKAARKKIIKTGMKFTSEYHNAYALPIVCDAIIVNTNNEILLEERPAEDQLVGNYLTPPGGHVTDFDESLESELCREVEEETGLKVKANDLQLISSQTSTLRRLKKSTHLKVTYAQNMKFMWNTYLIKGLKPDMKLTPGDDAVELVWVPLKEVEKNDRISPEIRDIIKRAGL